MKLLLFLALFTFNLPHLEAHIGFGGYVPFARSYQTDLDGSRNTTDFRPYINFNYLLPLSDIWFLFPEIGYVLPKSGENSVKQKTTYFLLNGGYRFLQGSFLKFGVGTFITSIEGEGGTVTLNNGDSTSTFYQPSEKIKTYNSTFNLGLEHFVHTNWTVKLDAYIFGIRDSKKRTMSYALSANYYF